APLRPRKEERAGERSDERRDLHRPALRLQAEAVGEDHAQARDLSDGEVDEHDAAAQHLYAERSMRGRDQQPRGKCGSEYRRVYRREVHRGTASSRASVSSKSPKRSCALSLPPTVNASATAGIFARSESHSAARGSL